jgi:hypothetical protein
LVVYWHIDVKVKIVSVLRNEFHDIEVLYNKLDNMLYRYLSVYNVHHSFRISSTQHVHRLCLFKETSPPTSSDLPVPLLTLPYLHHTFPRHPATLPIPSHSYLILSRLHLPPDPTPRSVRSRTRSQRITAQLHVPDDTITRPYYLVHRSHFAK